MYWGVLAWLQVAQVGHCLRVDVVRAENLPRQDLSGASDPYALVTAQSEAGLQMFRTKTIWSTTVRTTLCSAVLSTVCTTCVVAAQRTHSCLSADTPLF